MKPWTWMLMAALAATLAACEPNAPASHEGPAKPANPSAARTRTALPTTPATAGDVGTVAGTFLRVGGPIGPGGAQPRPMPLTGTLTFAAGHHRTLAVHVGKNGRFSVGLPAGNYLVSGRAPSIMEVLASGATVEDQCSPLTPVTVVAGRTVHVSVVCPVP